MQTLPALARKAGRVVCFVPNWLPPEFSPSGMPYKVFPVLSSLAQHGFEVNLFTEVHDGVDSGLLRDALCGCAGAVAWCSELNPGVQIPGLLRFLEITRELSPSTPRVAGGGFFILLPENMRGLDSLAHTILTDWGVPSVAKFLRGRLPKKAPECNIAGSKADAIDPYSLYELDLRPFIRPEPMIFGNNLPSLQIPTGFGCAKHCMFCFYERTRPQLLDAERIVELLETLVERYGVRQFLMGELDFFTIRKRVVEVARGIVERRLGIRWFALVSIDDIDRLTDEELDLIAESGCHILELGTEAGSDEALQRIGKKFNMEAVFRSTRRLLHRGIVPAHNIVFGFVGETPKNRRATLRLVRQLHALSPCLKFFFRIYQAVPNTTMGEEAMRHLPEFPNTIQELASYRMEMEDGRSMPWLRPAEEREVKLLAQYLLPLAYDDFMIQGKPSWTRRFFRRLADLRCRLGIFRWPVDRAMFRRMEQVGLASTFLP